MAGTQHWLTSRRAAILPLSLSVIFWMVPRRGFFTHSHRLSNNLIMFRSCDFFNNFIGYLGTVVLCASQGISIYRISSMYSHSRKVICLLLAALVVEVISMIIIQCIANTDHAAVPEPAPGVHLCKQGSFPRWSAALWIPIICFELVALALVASEAVRFYQSRKIIRVTIIATSGHSLMFILLRQTIAFQIIGIIICIPDVIAWYRLPYLAGQMTFSFVLGATCIMSSRLILDLREAYYQPFEEEMSFTFAHDLEQEDSEGATRNSINEGLSFRTP
ncbi:hypothetical protein CPC08DRAFT_761236 [Agrocybe pediades]|nr:hypothetical protein CPC08DRAFT_761236 [Agrocybe pediades]